MPRPSGAAQRVVEHLTLGAIVAVRRRDARNAEMGYRELELQYQFTISGTSGTTPGFAPVTIVFDHPFYYAPGQRDSNLDKPQFYFGAEITSATPVGVHAVVTGWAINSRNGSITGATVSLGAVGDGSAFTGVAHLTFQGWGALAEDEAVGDISAP